MGNPLKVVYLLTHWSARLALQLLLLKEELADLLMHKFWHAYHHIDDCAFVTMYVTKHGVPSIG